MRESGHRLDGDALALQLGARWRGRVPLSQIAGAVRTVVGNRKGALTPFDAPNVELTLRAPVRLTTYLGLTRAFSSLRLFVDDPDRLLTTLRARLDVTAAPPP
jgi:hypothetical protein